ncbi:dynein axonemal heavy chain 1-like [Synchiropus splendidus]|uniref:dynein axonemal heavy chain 1-like n=1 Tax=Synchiropus splendidus TaxID=270530 RepID=UPI00237EA462|nr:dynein axonemal heavy chain 1-like [Synchiropus splendidus]
MESPYPDRQLPERRFRTGGHRSKLVMTKQRGVYSDDIITISRFKMLSEQRQVQQRPQSEPSIHYKEFPTQDAPPVKFEFDYCKLTNFFSSDGDKPKCRVPFETGLGQTPRKLAIERLRREYMRIDFEELLGEKGIDSAHMMSGYSEDWEASPTEQVLLNLPIEIFDNEDFDCRTPDDWLSLGCADGAHGRKPIPAKALLPGEEGIYAHSWQLVGVADYCTKRHQYMVQRVLVKRSLDEAEVDPSLYEEHKKSNTWGVDILVEKQQYWVPRIKVFFVAEDPRVFVQRLQFALLLKKYTEANIQYHKSVDRLPVSNATPSIENESLRRIARIALSAPNLRPQLVKKFIGDLEKRVKQEYDRTMNILIYEEELKSALEQLPQEELLPIRKKECACVPDYKFLSIKRAFASKYLLSNTQVIRALSEVEIECRKVASLRLFNVLSETQSLKQ